MESYILSFRAPLKALLQRQQIAEKLAKEYPQLGSIRIEMDDKQFVMSVQSTARIEQEIQQTLLSYGYRVVFVHAKASITMDLKHKTA